MAEEEVKLLGLWSSPFSLRIKVALKLKGIQYQYIEEDLSNKSCLLLKSNPVHKKIPVLIHNGKPIAESLLILEYIDEIWQNNPILPKDLYDRAMALFWAKFIDEMMMEMTFKTSKAKGEELEQIKEEEYQYLEFLEKELKGKEFFGGETIGYLDIVGVFIHWFQLVHEEVLKMEFITEEKFPALHKCLGNIREIEVVKECLPPRDKHIALMKTRIEATSK